MGVEDRVAPRLRVPAAARRIRRDDNQKGSHVLVILLSALTVRGSLVLSVRARSETSAEQRRRGKLAATKRARYIVPLQSEEPARPRRYKNDEDAGLKPGLYKRRVDSHARDG
jgi:hypothetical protein